KTREKRQLTHGLRANNPNFSPDGKTLAFELNRAGARGLGLYDLRSGRVDELLPPANFEMVYTPSYSPDGHTIAFSCWRTGGYPDIGTTDLATHNLPRIPSDRAVDLEPRFSPDGRYLYFVSDRTGIYNLYAYERATQKLFQVTNVLTG